MLTIHSIVSGVWSRDRDFLAATIESLPDSAVRDRIEELHLLQLPASEIARDFGAIGHVVDTVPLALYCVQSIALEPFTTVLAARSVSAVILIPSPRLPDSLPGRLSVCMSCRTIELPTSRVMRN